MVKFVNLGIIDFESAFNRQIDAVAQVRSGADDIVLFCQHSPSCIVLGRRADKRNILKDEEFLSKKGISVVSAPRGGDVTLHNPGGLVVYPILDLARYKKDIRFYFNMLEAWVGRLLEGYGIRPSFKDDARGVWLGERKICSIGISIRHWITFFGLALNVNNDLSEFTYIRPCGQDIEMTSMQRELGGNISIDEVTMSLRATISETKRSEAISKMEV